jgi:hypothetical protein
MIQPPTFWLGQTLRYTVQKTLVVIGSLQRSRAEVSGLWPPSVLIVPGLTMLSLPRNHLGSPRYTSLFMARNGHGAMSDLSPLSEAKQKSDLWGRNADAKRNLPQILRCGQAASEGA